MRLTYAGRSRPSAYAIASEGDIEAVRSGQGDINWGRAVANTELNPDISSVTNKKTMRVQFAKNHVPMPKLYVSPKAALEAVIDGKTVIGRPSRHARGRGYWLIKNQRDMIRSINGVTFRDGRRKQPASHYMEFVKAPREYRVHIFLGKSIRISEKDHTAFHEYTTVKPQHNIKHVRKAAKKALEAVGLDFGAVDVLADDKNCWVLEVNAAPGLGGSMPRLYADVFNKWYKGEWK